MNKQRRNLIGKLIDEVTALQERIDEVLQEEQDYYDNIPENLANSERAQNSDEAISCLEDALSSIEDCVSSLEEATEY